MRCSASVVLFVVFPRKVKGNGRSKARSRLGQRVWQFAPRWVDERKKEGKKEIEKIEEEEKRTHDDERC